MSVTVVSTGEATLPEGVKFIDASATRKEMDGISGSVDIKTLSEDADIRSLMHTE